MGASEGGEFDPVAAGPAAGLDGALDEAGGVGVDAEVELVELAVAGLVAVALNEGLEPGPLLDGALDGAQRVVAAVGGDARGGEGVEDAELVAEVERRLEVAVLVEEVLRAGAVLLPLVRPELEPVARRARQRRPLPAQGAQEVAHLHVKLESYFSPMSRCCPRFIFWTLCFWIAFNTLNVSKYICI